VQPADVPPGAYHLWSPFPAATKYFEPATREFMINLMVDDVDGALAQVRAAGGHAMPDVERSEYGDFGWFVDPEGNKVELWRPPGPAKAEGA
jgi:predicted enzyme related to lactoylglutathione lyase